MEYGYDICWDETAFRAMRNVFNYLKKNISEEIALKFKSDVFAAAKKYWNTLSIIPTTDFY